MPLRNFFKNKKYNDESSSSSSSSSSSLLNEKLSLLKPSTTNTIPTYYDTKSSPSTETPIKLHDDTSYSSVDSTTTLLNHGYKIIKITPTLQGEIIEASCFNTAPTQKYTIKKVYKTKSFSEKPANIIREASLLRYCSDNTYICKYIDFFSDESYYYLVTEQVSNTYINLKDWVNEKFVHISNDTLTIKQYRNIIKCILYKIST
eukprot:887029_1